MIDRRWIKENGVKSGAYIVTYFYWGLGIVHKKFNEEKLAVEYWELREDIAELEENDEMYPALYKYERGEVVKCR